jgi:hypothetical protein
MGQDREMHSPPRPGRNTLLFMLVAGWLAVIAIPPVVLLQLRAGWLEALESPAVQADWDAFRRDMRAQSGRDAPVTGPVQRKVPKSEEPPLKVWLREYVGLAVAAWVLFGSVLFGFFAALIAGLFAQNQPRGGCDSQKDQKRDGEDAQQ